MKRATTQRLESARDSMSLLIPKSGCDPNLAPDVTPILPNLAPTASNRPVEARQPRRGVNTNLSNPQTVAYTPIRRRRHLSVLGSIHARMPLFAICVMRIISRYRLGFEKYLNLS